MLLQALVREALTGYPFSKT